MATESEDYKARHVLLAQEVSTKAKGDYREKSWTTLPVPDACLFVAVTGHGDVVTIDWFQRL